MSDAMSTFVTLDLAPLLAAVFASLACGLLGNFLVLRRESLMGDAISHSVLPGLVIAFLLTGTRSPMVMFIGAAVAGVATVVLVELVKRLGRVEPGAAMGVVFSVLFALGVLLIRQAAENVDLDADCVLHGDLEAMALYWFPPTEWNAFLSWSTLTSLPRQVLTLGVVLIVTVLFVGVFYKELRITSFDPALATSQGIHAGAMHLVLMVLVAIATVASFEAVGSILVIAMLICPAATARLMTDRLRSQIIGSAVIAIIAGVVGYFSASLVPSLFVADATVNAAGMIVIVSGLLLTVAAIVSPSHGLLAAVIRRRRLARGIAVDDLLAALFRLYETGQPQLTRDRLAPMLPGRLLDVAVAQASARGLVRTEANNIALTPTGLESAAEIVRRHRLWESYLVSEAGVAPDHVHDIAEMLEHVTVQPRSGPATDPHGRPIPGSES
ncbi:MAG: metal ABC transporter permease [Planctomycetota bacterium]